jgi:small-conductance mechanosensitive channel
MKIREIMVSQKIQIKQYEPLDLAITATLGEDEDVNQAIDDLFKYVDYKLRQDQRKTQFDKYTAELETDIGEKRREILNQWFVKYHELEKEILTIEFK